MYAVHHKKLILVCSKTAISGLTKQKWNSSYTWSIIQQMSDRREKPATWRRNRSEECIVAATNQTMTADLSTDNENQRGVTFVGIIQDKSNNQNIGYTTSVTCNNNEDQQNHIHTSNCNHNEDQYNHIHTSNKSNHSEIGIVSDFVSVSDKTGNTSSLSEEQLSNVDISLYIPALLHLKKIISSQEEFKWKGITAKFFYKKMNVEQRLQESWWAGTWHKVRKGIDSKWAKVAAAIKNEFMSEYIKAQFFSFSYHEKYTFSHPFKTTGLKGKVLFQNCLT